MKRIFVFCAYHKRAQENYAKSVRRPIPSGTVTQCFAPEEHPKILKAMASPEGFYAWGFKAGKRLVNTLWRVIEPGDVAIGFFARHYRVAARVLAKVENENLANTVWPNRPGLTDSWRLVVLLSTPHFIEVPASDVLPYLPSEYRGAMCMNEGRLNRIVADFGTVENFVHQRLCPEFEMASVATVNV